MTLSPGRATERDPISTDVFPERHHKTVTGIAQFLPLSSLTIHWSSQDTRLLRTWGWGLGWTQYCYSFLWCPGPPAPSCSAIYLIVSLFSFIKS